MTRPGTVLQGAARQRAIDRHARWLSGRMPSEVFNHGPMDLRLADWLESRPRTGTRHYRRKT